MRKSRLCQAFQRFREQKSNDNSETRLPLCGTARQLAQHTHTQTLTDRRCVWLPMPQQMRPLVMALAAQTHHREAVACCVSD